MQDHATPRQDPILVAHEQTYRAFNVLIRWCMVALASSLLFLTLWFASTAGFFGGLAAGVVVFAVGYQLLIREQRGKPLDVVSPER